MPQTSLLLSVSRASWDAPISHGTASDNHPRMKELRGKILARDNHTCQGCGWRAEEFQEIHHRDDDHKNFSEANLETLCPLCHQVFHLRQAEATNGGSIIWLPEMSQADLNRMCFSLFVAAKAPKGQWAGIARTQLASFEGRKSTLEHHLGRSSPGILAEVLLSLPPEEYARRHTMLQHLRLLPHAARFQAAIDHWEAVVFQSAPADQWESFLPAHIKVNDLVPDATRE